MTTRIRLNRVWEYDGQLPEATRTRRHQENIPKEIIQLFKRSKREQGKLELSKVCKQLAMLLDPDAINESLKQEITKEATKILALLHADSSRHEMVV
jgi:hypothetical protein